MLADVGVVGMPAAEVAKQAGLFRMQVGLSSARYKIVVKSINMERSMKSIVVSMIAAAGLMVAGSAMAVDMPAEAAPCKACHAIDKKVVGPAWKDVAAKYKGDADAVNKIAANIKKGGQFGWKMGAAMPPKGMAKSDADIQKLAEFIAGLK